MSDDPPAWVRAAEDGSVLRVHVRPGAGRAALVGFHGEALCARVVARPVDGAANRELTAVLAKALGIRPAAVRIVTGTHARDKGIHVRGLDVDAVRARIGVLLYVDKAGPRH
jgi:uncharacterized protein (TIGR00251 family)